MKSKFRRFSHPKKKLNTLTFGWANPKSDIPPNTSQISHLVVLCPLPNTENTLLFWGQTSQHKSVLSHYSNTFWEGHFKFLVLSFLFSRRFLMSLHKAESDWWRGMYPSYLIHVNHLTILTSNPGLYIFIFIFDPLNHSKYTKINKYIIT